MSNVISGTELAKTVRARVADELTGLLPKAPRPPCLVAVSSGADAGSEVYLRNKRKACQGAGIAFRLETLPEDAGQDGLNALLDRLNADPSVDAVLVQSPLPAGFDEAAAFERVAPEKDVDCFHPVNLGLLLQRRPRFLPCTPAGVMEILRLSGVKIAGASAVVVGRSLIVGTPLAALLTQADATVTVCHSKTAELAAVCSRADILVAATGRPGLIGERHVRDGAVVIDVGINRLADGTITGDVDFEAVAPKCSVITPVPGGVGPMTVAMLVKNVVEAWRQRFRL